MEPKPGAPKNWADAAKILKKGSANVTDTDLFGDDPLAPPSPGKAKPLEYLGHFANDNVMGMGHNVGAKQVGVKEAGSGKVAHCGYRAIPGNVNVPYVAKKVREAVEAKTTTSARYGGPIPASGYGPMMAAPDAAPLRKRDRIAKASAKRPQGPLTSTAKKR